MLTNLQEFSKYWERETNGTLALLRALPEDQYDFRPDPDGRSIGELAWHLAEVDAYITFGIDRGDFAFKGAKPLHMERPRAVAGLAPGFRVVHQDAAARIARLKPEDLDRTLPYADGEPWTI